MGTGCPGRGGSGSGTVGLATATAATGVAGTGDAGGGAGTASRTRATAAQPDRGEGTEDSYAPGRRVGDQDGRCRVHRDAAHRRPSSRLRPGSIGPVTTRVVAAAASGPPGAGCTACSVRVPRMALGSTRHGDREPAGAVGDGRGPSWDGAAVGQSPLEDDRTARREAGAASCADPAAHDQRVDREGRCRRLLEASVSASESASGWVCPPAWESAWKSGCRQEWA